MNTKRRAERPASAYTTLPGSQAGDLRLLRISEFRVLGRNWRRVTPDVPATTSYPFLSFLILFLILMRPTVLLTARVFFCLLSFDVLITRTLDSE